MIINIITQTIVSGAEDKMKNDRTAQTACDLPVRFTVEIQPAAPSGVELTAASKTALKGHKNFSAVYVLRRDFRVQYVGESSRLPARLIDGTRAKGRYTWPVAGEYELIAWEITDSPAFRKATELEVAMRIRMITGEWPVELKGLSPQHTSRMGNNYIRAASLRAREIAAWLNDAGMLPPTEPLVETPEFNPGKEMMQRFEDIEEKRVEAALRIRALKR